MRKRVSAASDASRLAAIVTMLFTGALITALPSRYQLGPNWLSYTAVGAMLGAMLLPVFFPRNAQALRIERIVVLVLVVLAEIGNVISTTRLIADMMKHHHNYGSIALLQSAAAIWTLNVVLPAFLYWHLDRGGPGSQRESTSVARDFNFADDRSAADLPQPPGFVDYIYLAFAVSTAFVLPDYMRPISARAKLITLGQALVSIATLFLIAARAISTLS